MNVAVIGSQFGDEGKGAMVDIFGEAADIVVRYQGGDNAGHTVVHEDEEYKLRLTPSGVIRGKINIIGNGCVVNPNTLFDEIDRLRDRGLDPDVRVAERAHVVFPYHQVLDSIEEESRADDGIEVGTTGNGIGPAYEDKAGRRGIRIGDLCNAERFREQLEYVVPQKRRLAEEVFGINAGEEFDVDALFQEYVAYGERLQQEEMLVNAGSFLTEKQREGANILFEGAQGTHIDIDHGNYPYVTSSNPIAGGAAVGSGVDPAVVGDGEIIGPVKGYLSRVGSGPMPSEIEGDIATQIREAAGEFGTVTGRPRRIGWLDMPMLRHSQQVNGYTGITISHLDVLAGLPELKVCHAYEIDGESRLTVPTTTDQWADCDPDFRSFQSWEQQDWGTVVREGYEALPHEARTYIEYVSDELSAPIYAVSVGQGRDDTIVLKDPYE